VTDALVPTVRLIKSRVSRRVQTCLSAEQVASHVKGWSMRVGYYGMPGFDGTLLPLPPPSPLSTRLCLALDILWLSRININNASTPCRVPSSLFIALRTSLPSCSWPQPRSIGIIKTHIYRGAIVFGSASRSSSLNPANHKLSLPTTASPQLIPCHCT
jgi:hypothetical protein